MKLTTHLAAYPQLQKKCCFSLWHNYNTVAKPSSNDSNWSNIHLGDFAITLDIINPKKPSTIVSGDSAHPFYHDHSYNYNIHVYALTLVQIGDIEAGKLQDKIQDYENLSFCQDTVYINHFEQSDDYLLTWQFVEQRE